MHGAPFLPVLRCPRGLGSPSGGWGSGAGAGAGGLERFEGAEGGHGLCWPDPTSGDWTWADKNDINLRDDNVRSHLLSTYCVPGTELGLPPIISLILTVGVLGSGVTLIFILFSHCLLLVCRLMIGFCILTLYRG